MKLTATTPAGVFARKTETRYTHVNVWSSPRAKTYFDDPSKAYGGVTARWVKDRGYAVTWHSSARAAEAASRKGYVWDSEAVLIGTFPVDPKE